MMSIMCLVAADESARNNGDTCPAAWARFLGQDKIRQDVIANNSNSIHTLALAVFLVHHYPHAETLHTLIR